MELNLKKLCPALAVAFVTLTSVVCAVDDMQVRNLENRVSALEQRRGANGMINPPARPVVRDGSDLWIQVEALYMQATEDGLAYGIKNGTASPIDGTVKNVNYDWNWGFRAGLGYNLPHDGWDVLFNWTWLYSSDKKTDSPSAPESVIQTQTAPTFATTPAVTSAKGRVGLHTNILDFELGREFFVSKWLTLRPFGGIRGAWLNRNFRYSYATAPKTVGHNHNRFRGAGLRGGLDTQWGLGSGWSFFADAALSLIYGMQRLHNHQDAGATRIQHYKNNWHVARPMLDLGAGLRWDHLFSCDAYRIRIQFGWEQSILWGFNKDMNFVNAAAPGKYTFNQGDLSYSGVALQFRFDF
jgi:hypothetical protein